MDTKENEEVKTPVTEEVAPKETDSKKDSTTKHTSEKPDKNEDIIKSQTGQIQALQKKIEELEKAKPDIKSALKELIGDEKVEPDVDPIETLKSEWASLKTELNQTKAEKRRNDYIDNLENVSEARKKYLKKIIKTDENIEKTVEDELATLDEVFTSERPVARDYRPSSIGSVKGNSTDADFILDNPDKFKS